MIFNTDDRIKISPQSAPNVGYFVQIVSYFSDGYTAQGSGVMIGSNDVLTAGHVTYSQDHQGFPTSVKVTPAKFGTYEPYGYTSADNIMTNSGWSDAQDFTYDYGVISLSKAIGFQTGWLPFAYLNSPEQSIGTNLISYGYPGDKQSGNWLYETSGTPDDTLYSNILLFRDDFDTYFGQSGSPVIYQTSSQETVVGVVSFQSNFPDANGILSLDANSYANISDWITRNDTNLEVASPIIISKSDHILSLYIAFFNRAPDSEGFNFWLKNQDTKDMAQLFSQHDYFSTTYNSLENQAFIESIYSNILGTQGDTQGILYWTNSLQKHTRAEVVDSIVTATLSASLQSQDFAYLSFKEYQEALYRQDTLKNKIEVAKAFTTTLKDKTDIQNQNIEQDKSYLASINIIEHINDDENFKQNTLNFIKDISHTLDPIQEINAQADLIGVSQDVWLS